jgi:hypothetical protein
VNPQPSYDIYSTTATSWSSSAGCKVQLVLGTHEINKNIHFILQSLVQMELSNYTIPCLLQVTNYHYDIKNNKYLPLVLLVHLYNFFYGISYVSAASEIDIPLEMSFKASPKCSWRKWAEGFGISELQNIYSHYYIPKSII